MKMNFFCITSHFSDRLIRKDKQISHRHKDKD